jgi:hypothetical protein
MLGVMNLSQKAGANVTRPRIIVEKLEPKGKFILEHIRDGKVIATYEANNAITNEGKNLILDTMFYGATQVSAANWFIGLISLASYSALAAADVMSSHAGWLEYIAYTEAARQAWGPGAASGQITTNASAATFNINGAGGTVKGIFITSIVTISGTTGHLWATALFAGDIVVTSGDQLKVTYSVSC